MTRLNIGDVTLKFTEEYRTVDHGKYKFTLIQFGTGRMFVFVADLNKLQQYNLYRRTGYLLTFKSGTYEGTLEQITGLMIKLLGEEHRCVHILTTWIILREFNGTLERR